MTANASINQVLNTHRVKIGSIDKAKGLIRLINEELGNQEYLTTHLNLDPRFQTGDFLDAVIEGGKIISLAYPPGGEPKEPAKIQVPPQEAVKPSQPAKPRPPHIMHIGQGFVIIAGTTNGDQKFTLIDNALKYIKSFKVGDLVNFSCQGTDKIKSMWKVDENGVRPVRDNQQPGQSQKQSKVVSIGGTINLGSFENLKIEVSGPYETLDDIKKYKDELSRIAGMFGGNEQTREIIHGYCDRVIGGK